MEGQFKQFTKKKKLIIDSFVNKDMKDNSNKE